MLRRMSIVSFYHLHRVEVSATIKPYLESVLPDWALRCYSDDKGVYS
jgi:hypothetical protein